METSPLLSEFHRGAIGMKRTKSNISRSFAHLTLEQTISDDANNQLAKRFSADSIYDCISTV